MSTKTDEILAKYGAKRSGETSSVKNSSNTTTKTATKTSEADKILSKYGAKRSDDKADVSGEAWTHATPSQTVITTNSQTVNSNAGNLSVNSNAGNLYSLQEQRRQAQVDMDIDTMNRLDAQIKQAKQDAGIPTGAQRLGNMLYSAALDMASNLTNKAGVDMDVRGGTAMTSVYQEQADRLRRQIAMAEENLKDPNLDAAMRKELEDAIKQYQQQLDIYDQSVYANKETSKGLYETADMAGTAAKNSLNSATNGLASQEAALVKAGTGLMGLAMQRAADRLAPGFGTVVRGANIGGATSKAYRNSIDAQNEAREAFGVDEKLEYDPNKAQRLQGITGAGAYIGAGASRLVGNSALNVMKSLGVQNLVLPNIISGGVTSTSYAMGETAAAELAKALTYDNYEPNWEEIGTTAVSAFAFGAISQAVNIFKTTSQNKTYIKNLNENVKNLYEQYSQMANEQQKAAGAAKVMDGVENLRQAINNLQVVGAQKEVDAINQFLNSIDAEMAQYLQSASVSQAPATVNPIAPKLPDVQNPSTGEIVKPSVPTSPVPPANVPKTTQNVQPQTPIVPKQAGLAPAVKQEDISNPTEGNDTQQEQNVSEAVLEAATEAVARQQDNNGVSEAPKQASMTQEQIETAIANGKRVPQVSISNEQYAALSDRGDVDVDADGNVYQVSPEQHISQRTADSVKKTSVNAFQFDHPILQKYYKEAAQALINDASLSLDTPQTRKVERGAQGKRYVTEILESPSLRSAMDMGLSRDKIIKAAQDLIADSGQENYAAAKKLELVLDEMLTNGYTTARGEQVEPNSAYIAEKQQIAGYQERTPEELPIYDMPEAASIPSEIQPVEAAPASAQVGVQAAYEAGKAELPREMANLETEAQVNAYEQGRRDAILSKPSETTVEKPASEEYTGGEKIGTQESIPTKEEMTNGRGEEVPDTGNAQSAGSIGQTDTGGNASKRERYEIRIKEILRKHETSSRRNREQSGRVERKETRNDFEDRMRAGGYFYAETKNGGAAMGFKPAKEEIWSSEAKTAHDALKKWGFEVIVFDGEMHTNHKGVSDISSEGQTLRDGMDITIFLSSGLDIDGLETAYHEALHAIRTGPNSLHRVKIENAILDNIDVECDAFENFVNRIADLYSYSVRDVSEDRFAAEITEEAYAWFVGKIHASDPGVWGLDIDAFSDAKSAKAEIDAIFSEMEVNPKPVTNTPAVKKDAVKAPAVNPQQQIADGVKKYLEKGQDFSSDRLFEIANKAYGGTMSEGAYTVKDAYDGMELAVNQYLMASDVVKNGNGNAAQAVKTLDKLVEMLSHIPTQTKRTAEMESYQQFSTPPNIAYLAAWCANVDAQDVVLEPSAGIGGLALWPKAWGATVYGNELSERRLAFLNQLGLDGTFNLNAEQIDNMLPDNIKPSVVIMNPPFSATAGRTATNKTANAKRHIEQALERLEDGGRLVAILGNGMADDAPAFRNWWDSVRRDYNVRANIQIDGSNYRKYGTTFDVQMVVIDKTGPNMGPTLTRTFKDLSEIPNFMEGIRNDRTRETGARGVLQDDNAVSVGSGRGERTPGRVADGSGSGKPAGNAGTRNVDGRDGQNGVRGRSGQNVSGVRGQKGSGKPVQSDGGSTDGRGMDAGNAGPGMVLSGRAQSDSVGKPPVIDENPDSVYSTYTPKKVHIEGAKKHPAKLVESAAMAAVDPPDVTYTPHLPARIAKDGILSDAQLENVVYAGQAHEQMLGNGSRKGYFIGDGTGVGKGRQISGIIMDNFMQGRKKAVWISASAELVNDAKRDWKDLGGNPDDVIDMRGTKLIKNGIQADSGILFGAYSTLANSKNKDARFKMIRDWLGADFDGVIALDEAHKMGNSVVMKKGRGKTKPSQQALTGIELQEAFPNARVVYASATGATDVSQYGYLERLGLWGKGTAFNDLNDFITKISNGGLAAMELVARDMKSMGVYMARSISYDDVKYDTLQHDLTPMQTEIYDTMSRAWQKVLQNVNQALEVTGASNNGQARGAAFSALFGGQQRFYNQILTSMAMPSVIADMRKELDAGRSCVLQLTNTNAAQADRAIAKNEEQGGDLDDIDLTPSETLVQLLEKSFPVTLYEEYTDERGNTKSRPVYDKDGNPVEDKKAIRMRDNLIAEMQQMKVPDGPLEMLLDAFGVDQVAEVTGRSRRVVEKVDENGQKRRVIEKRNAATAGTADAKMFQDGKKRILVFSQAGGTGFSYHADLRAKNQQQRVHYLLQAGWSASDAVQGFGRTHRSNQASAPIVRLITTNVMGQKRFTSTIARRLDQLGALTKGQRQAGSGVFSEKDNLENPIAADALATYYKSVDRGVLKKLGLYDKICDEYGRINESAEDLRNVSKFLNRILSLEVKEQNEVFQGFYDTFERMMDVAIANGTVDMGLENYRADKIEVKDEKVIRKDPSGADTKYVQMTAYRKPELVSFAAVKKSGQNFQGLVRLEDGSVRAVFEISGKTNPRTGEIQRRFKLESPVRGKSSVYVEETLKAKTTAIDKAEWDAAWKEETAKAPEYNESTLHLLTGTLLPIWNRLPENNTRVMRVISSDGRQYLGRVIRPDQIDGVLKNLGANRTMQTYTPKQISDAVLTQGKEVILRDNRQKIVRRRVSGEWRMEVVGQNTWYLQRQYPGIITERINYEYRYFIPTGDKGSSILTELMKDNPVVDVRDAAPDDVDRMVAGNNANGEWTANRVGSADKKPMALSEIIEKIRHDFGINITTGHVRGKGVMGTFNRGNKGIRSKIANDLPTVSHELGHYLDLTYGLTNGLSNVQRDELMNGLSADMKAAYPQRKWTTEGLAEYIREFLRNRDEAASNYPEFTKHFLNSMSGKDAALLEQLADEVNAYFALDTDTATSSIRFSEEGTPDARTFPEKIREKASVLYQAWLDSNHGIKLFDDATGSDAYKLATNAAYSDAMAGQIIVGDLTGPDGQYVGPGLSAALKDIDLKNKDEYRLFGEYLVVRHGPERLKEGMRIFADDRKNDEAWMQARQAAIESQHPEFADAADKLYQFQKDFLQTWGVGTGLVSSDKAQEWADRWSFYVPFNRAVKGGGTMGARRGFANQNSTINRAHGSGLDIVHPVDNIVNNIVKMVNAGVRNNVMRKITDSAERMGANAVFLEKVPTPMKRTSFRAVDLKENLTAAFDSSGMDAADKDIAFGIIDNIDDILYQYGKGKAHGDVVTVMKDGKQEFWKINDPLLLSSITSLSPKKMDGILDTYAVVSRFMTSNITGNNLIWSIFSNMPRDMMTMFTYSKDKNPLHILGGMASAYANSFKHDGQDPLFKEYLAMGGGKTSAYTADKDLAKRARSKLSGEKFKWYNPMEYISFMSDLIEMGPRFATYKLMRQRGMTPQEAFYEAGDITVNFRRGGTVSREMNKVFPFFNASMQGIDKFARWITASDAPNSSRKKVAKSRMIGYLAASAALAALFYGMNNADDDKEKDYQQLSNFIKNSYWNIPLGDGKYFSIPKPRELGVLTSLFETAAEYFAGENPHAFDDFFGYVVDNCLPTVAADLVTGDWEGAIGSIGIVGTGAYIMANRDFLGKPIVSNGLQYLEKPDQYNERTSRIAVWIGRAFNMSPQQIDYFFSNVLGGFWKAQKALFPVGSENRDLTLGVQGSYIKDNQYSTDLVNWMYDKASASSAAKNSDKSNMEKAITAKMDSNMASFYGNYYKLSKNVPDTTTHRGTRQIVLDMILEYRKAADSGYTSKAQEAVYDVVKAAGSTELLPSVMNVEVKDGNDEKHMLSDVQYVEFQTDYLRMYWEMVEDSLPDAKSNEEKVAVLEAAKTVAKERAVESTLKRICAPTTKFTTKYKGIDDADIIDFLAGVDMANDDGSLKQEEIIKIIKDMHLSKRDSSTLFNSRYESDKNNPWK